MAEVKISGMDYDIGMGTIFRKVHYITLPTTLGTTSDDGATTTASQDSTIAVQQPTIDNQYPLLDEGTQQVLYAISFYVLSSSGPIDRSIAHEDGNQDKRYENSDVRC